MCRNTSAVPQRAAAWILLLHYLFSLLVISLPAYAEPPQKSVDRIYPQNNSRDGQTDPLLHSLAAVWGNAQQSGGGDALRAEANSRVNAALTQEVERWLTQDESKARVTADVGLAGSKSRDIGLDYLWPLKTWQHDILFTQLSAHRWNDRNIINLGVGWRHSFTPQLMAGSNLFYDRDLSRQHNRLGVGAEVWSDRVRTSLNYYLPLSGWRDSSDRIFNDDPRYYDLYERAARGWDLNMETALTQHIAAKAGWFQWYGDKVDVTGKRSHASRDPHGLQLGLKWRPVPLIGASIGQDFISGQRDNFTIGVNLNWIFDRTLAEMLDPGAASALPTLLQSRNEFVTRNNNIVLAYRQQEKNQRLWFDPTEKETEVGIALLHQVQGGRGGPVVYSSSQPEIASVNANSGLVTPKQRGVVMITATEMAASKANSVVSSASYRLTITPGNFKPSVSEVQITGNMVVNGQLLGTYRYHNNGGEDEAPERTKLRWYDKASMTLLQDGGKSYALSSDDMLRTIIFAVTPVNKKGIEGETGQAEISGSATLAELNIDKLLTPGEIRADGSVKFFSGEGALQLVATVKDKQGGPLAQQKVFWHSKSTLGSLEQPSSLTDADGQARVIIHRIIAGGQDQIVASLTPQAVMPRNPGDTQKRRPLSVIFSHSQSMSMTAAPDSAQVDSENRFTVQVYDQDSAPLTTPVEVKWKSNDTELTSKTNHLGISTVTLKAPQQMSAGWTVAAQVAELTPVATSVSLLSGEVADLTVQSDRRELDADGRDVAILTTTAYDAYNNPVANAAISWELNDFSLGALRYRSSLTDSQGQGTAQLHAARKGGVAIVSIDIAGKQHSIQLPLHATPIINRATVTPTSNLKVGDRMQVTADVDENGSGPVSLSYQWLRNSAVISGATADSYILQQADGDTQISVRVTASNQANKTTIMTTALTDKVGYPLAMPVLTVVSDGAYAGVIDIGLGDPSWYLRYNLVEVLVTDTRGTPVPNTMITAGATSGGIVYESLLKTDSAGKAAIFISSTPYQFNGFRSLVRIGYQDPAESGKEASVTVTFKSN